MACLSKIDIPLWHRDVRLAVGREDISETRGLEASA